MKVLIVTQVVDTTDSDLGFFVRWIEEFAKHRVQVHVICLRAGRHTLPENVQVHSLGKERGVSRLRYLFNFYRYLWQLRNDYDAVFVHMNPEYVILAGWLWQLWNKKLVLWYTHKSVNLRLRIAEWFVDAVCTASRESFRLGSKKVHVLGHGIDTAFFSSSASARERVVLTAGRLSTVKRHDLVIRAVAASPYELWIVGEGPERARLEALVHELGLTARTRFWGPQTQTELRDLYQRAHVFVHASETGSLDKVVLEALACGLPVITTSTSLGTLPVIRVQDTCDALAEALTNLGAVSEEEREAAATYVREHHSLERLVPKILTYL